MQPFNFIFFAHQTWNVSRYGLLQLFQSDQAKYTKTTWENGELWREVMTHQTANEAPRRPSLLSLFSSVFLTFFVTNGRM